MANLLNDYKYDGAQVPMAEVRVLHGACGTQILAIRSDTFKIFTPGLRENADRIRSIPPVTESYGSHARHKVDIYQSHAHNTGNEPILIFLYAGGLTRGNRKLEVVPEGLVYNNLGTYFASRGITTLVPDYRRVDGKKAGDGAVSIPTWKKS
jgi:acetyl esterase/lipase